MKDPAFWSTRMDRMTLRNASLDEVMSESAALEGLTAKQIQDTFARYYARANLIEVVVVPEPGSDKDSGSKKD